MRVKAESTVNVTDYQVFGERNSGTNFVSALIRRNLQVEGRNQYGWKHGFPTAVGYSPASLIVVVYRDPIDWLVSLFNKPRTMPRKFLHRSFQDFLNNPFYATTAHMKLRGWRRTSNSTVPDDLPAQPVQADMDPITGLPFDTPMALRTAKLQAFLGFENRAPNVVFVQYEHVRDDPEGFLCRVQSTYGIDYRPDRTPVPEQAQPKNAFPAKPKVTRTDITSLEHKLISDGLNRRLEASIGYTY